MIRTLGAAAIACTGLLAWTGTADAAGRDFCHHYTDAALVQVRAAMSLPRCAERLDPGPRWSSDPHVQFGWCRGVSEATAHDEGEARKDFIERCRRW